ncbi:hypothetical protein PHLCEN_2v5430 [Hermanssonia centrifuga]|uniref:F-box domain-containing protein n=1 Tax=Hermanssonia centrifuga TaxID=98765 RepID=A0A2R6P2H4_9APHY|nr:hypothetical protein PHLCEN_2v5430 [Hermanssonia centrifuga]
MQASSRHHPTIFSIPTEVIEDVLVVLAEAKKPTSIAFLAQTCRYLRQIIYQPLDKYLWRRIFLSTFDDPRIYDGVYLLRNTEVFDWENEFRSRIWTASHIGSCIQALSKETSAYRLRSKQISIPASLPASPECDSFKRNLQSLLAVIDTSLPITHNLNISANEDDPSTSNQINPPFPPLIDTDRASPPVPAASGQEYSSKNIAWLQSVISKGLPREFYPRFDNNVGDPYWIEPIDGLLVHKLMAHIGFDSISVNGPTSVSPKRLRTRSNRCELVSEDGDWFEMSSEERFKRARFLARMKVFNVGYLSRRRTWGPFLPALDGTYTDDDDESDPDDADFIPESENTSNSGDEEEQDNLAHGPIPPPEDLYADWIHLAAIRMDVQACLQEHHQWEDIRESLTSLDGLRPGRWFPSRKHDNEQTSGSTYNIDWAGVEGVWRAPPYKAHPIGMNGPRKVFNLEALDQQLASSVFGLVQTMRRMIR